jgi:hypothetical protein
MTGGQIDNGAAFVGALLCPLPYLILPTIHNHCWSRSRRCVVSIYPQSLNKQLKMKLLLFLVQLMILSVRKFFAYFDTDNSIVCSTNCCLLLYNSWYCQFQNCCLFWYNSLYCLSRNLWPVLIVLVLLLVPQIGAYSNATRVVDRPLIWGLFRYNSYHCLFRS